MCAKKVLTVVGIAILMISSGLVGYWIAPGESEDLPSYGEYYQVSTYDRLADGVFGGGITIEQLLEHGDYGIGTVEGIDGEMIIVDGTAYRAGTDLTPVEVPAGTMIPFAMITELSFSIGYGVSNIDNYTEFKEQFGSLANSDICIGYGILMEAEFQSLTIRSVPGQNEPYPPLTDVIANQTTMVLHNVTGTMIGFLFSDSIEGANLPGFHMHFISDDLSYGGHVLDFSVDDAEMIASQLNSVTVSIVDG